MLCVEQTWTLCDTTAASTTLLGGLVLVRSDVVAHFLLAVFCAITLNTCETCRLPSAFWLTFVMNIFFMLG